MINNQWKKIESSTKNIIMWGASDQCRVNYPILENLGYTVSALIDDTPNKLPPFDHIPLFDGWEEFEKKYTPTDLSSIGYIISIGNPYGHIRVKLHKMLKEKGLRPVSFADNSSLISRSAIHGEGLQVMPAALIQNNVQIGDQCIIYTRALVDHDCVLNDGVEIGPGAVLCGRITVGENSWVGANSTIRERITIGKNSIVAAGAVVVKDVPDNVIVSGIPATILRENNYA